MKELTIEQKAKAYDEAIKRAKDFMNGEAHYELKIGENIMCWVFPELRESEDERMRAMAIKAVHSPEAQSCIKSWGINPDDVIAWLEKQGEQKLLNKCMYSNDNYTDEERKILCDGCDEDCKLKQKPVEWSEEDEKMIAALNEYVGHLDLIYEKITIGSDDICARDFREKVQEWLKSLKPQPKQEWSEDTQQWIDVIIKDYEDLYDADKDHRATIQAKINILKSLRPQSQWKPSNEQLYTLEKATHIVGSKYKSCLTSLYNDLKKLRGE